MACFLFSFFNNDGYFVTTFFRFSKTVKKAPGRVILNHDKAAKLMFAVKVRCGRLQLAREEIVHLKDGIKQDNP